MDFTYDNGVGPVSLASPFMNVGRNENLKSTISSLVSDSLDPTNFYRGFCAAKSLKVSAGIATYTSLLAHPPLQPPNGLKQAVATSTKHRDYSAG